MNKGQFSHSKIGILACLLIGSLVWWSNGGTQFRQTPLRQVDDSEPAITGPDELCIIFGAVVGTFDGGGNPSTDVYYWQITDPTGAVVLDRTGGSQFRQLQFSFQTPGTYRIRLRVRRNSDYIYDQQKPVLIRTGPSLVVLPDYLICDENPAVISAMDPGDPSVNQYRFKWTDAQGKVIGTSNTIEVSQEGRYYFELSSASGGCLITGNTYAGPSLDFKVQVSNPVICKGSEITLSTDTPLSGEWFLIRPGSQERESLGNAFEVPLKREDLVEAGLYTAIFRAEDPKYPGCQSTRRVSFEVNDTPILEVTVVEKPDNCGFPNGILQLTSLIQLDSLVIEELDQKWTSIAVGSKFTVSNLLPQIYTIVAYSEGCRLIRLFDLEPKVPPITYPNTPDIIPPTIRLTEESCGSEGALPGNLIVEFAQGNVSGEYRILAEGQGEIQRGMIQNQQELSLTVPGGIYFLELKIDGCTYPIEPLEIKKISSVEFNVPSELLICEEFDFLPETSQNLTFTLIAPDQTSQTLATGESFKLTLEGEYTLLGAPKDPSTNLCPKQEKFFARLSDSFSYAALLIEEDCFGNQVYEADLSGIGEDQVSIRWINENGTIVGRSKQYFSSFTGPHTLEVQPLKSGYCPTTPFSFVIEAPVLAVKVEFETEKICPDPGFAQLVLKTSQDNAVDSIAWIYFDDLGNRRELTEFRNQFEIQTDQPGNYEAVVFNRIGCEIGRNFTLVENSTLLIQPDLEEQYGVCAKNRKGPVLNPGDYAEYRWFFEGNLASENPTYMPEQVGNYSLEVTTKDGCTFSTTFTTVDLCFFEYRMTDAMILGDPSRTFEAWINQGLTEAELYIYNRQGELVHYQRMVENPSEGPVFRWHGEAFGKSVLPGTYAVVLKVGNPTYGFSTKLTQSLLVIE